MRCARNQVEAVVPPSESAKKGKREAEDELENQVSAKNQKRDEVTKKKKNEKEIKSDDFSSDSEQDKKPAKNGTLSTLEKKGDPAISSSSSEYLEDDSNEDEGVMDIDEGDSSEESDKEAQNKKMKALPNAASNAQKLDSKTVEKDTSSDSSDDDGNDDDDGDDSSDGSEKPHMVRKPVKDSEDIEEEIEEKSSKTPQESVKDVETVDAASNGKKVPKTPATVRQYFCSSSKTIYVRNLSYSVERADLENLFKECGEIVDVRLHKDNEGRFRGFGHVQFATAEAAQKALDLDNTELLKRPIRVGIAQEKGEYTPNSGFLVNNFSNLSNSFQKAGRVQSQTIFVKGFDRSLTKEKIKTSLEEHFSSCGEIIRISIPEYHDSGAVKGFAHLEFKDVDSLKKALQLHETELGGYPLLVEKAKPRCDYQDTCSGRGGGGPQFGGRDGGGHGMTGQWRSSGCWRR